MKKTCPLTSRDLVDIAANVTCQRVVRLRGLGLTDQQGYRLLSQEDLPRFRGERTAALRHGKVFDKRLVEHEASALLESLQSIVSLPPASVRILNLGDNAHSAKKVRLRLALDQTVQALNAAAQHAPTFDIILQPALALPVAGWGFMIVRPDALVLDPRSQTYWPLEAKAYQSIDGAIEPAERRAMRLQAAVQVVALREHYARLDPTTHIPLEAILVICSPFGMKPEPAVLENLDGEVNQIERAIASVNAEAPSLVGMNPDAQFHALNEAHWTFQESCLVGCGLARFCRSQRPDLRLALGDAAMQVFPDLPTGPTDPARLLGPAPDILDAWRKVERLFELEETHGFA